MKIKGFNYIENFAQEVQKKNTKIPKELLGKWEVNVKDIFKWEDDVMLTLNIDQNIIMASSPKLEYDKNNDIKLTYYEETHDINNDYTITEINLPNSSKFYVIITNVLDDEGNPNKIHIGLYNDKLYLLIPNPYLNDETIKTIFKNLFNGTITNDFLSFSKVEEIVEEKVVEKDDEKKTTPGVTSSKKNSFLIIMIVIIVIIVLLIIIAGILIYYFYNY